MRSGCKVYQVIASTDVSYDDNVNVGFYATLAEAEANAKLARTLSAPTSPRLYTDVRVVEVDVGQPCQTVNLCRDVWAIYHNGDRVQISTDVVIVSSDNVRFDFGPLLFVNGSPQRMDPNIAYDDSAPYHVVMYSLTTAKVNDVAQRVIIDELVGYADLAMTNGDDECDIIDYVYESELDWTKIWPEALANLDD